MHAVDRNYRFAELLGFADVPIAFDLPVQPQARAAVERKLVDGGLKPGEPYALIAPGTRWETKRWPAAHFAKVAEVMRSEHGLPVVLAGAPDEVIATLLGSTLSRLGEVTGRVFTERLLDEVFQRFCVGK